MLALGRLSFLLYLVNEPVQKLLGLTLAALARGNGALFTTLWLPGAMLLPLAAAWLLHVTIEQPALRLSQPAAPRRTQPDTSTISASSGPAPAGAMRYRPGAAGKSGSRHADRAGRVAPRRRTRGALPTRGRYSALSARQNAESCRGNRPAAQPASPDFDRCARAPRPRPDPARHASARYAPAWHARSRRFAGHLPDGRAGLCTNRPTPARLRFLAVLLACGGLLGCRQPVATRRPRAGPARCRRPCRRPRSRQPRPPRGASPPRPTPARPGRSGMTRNFVLSCGAGTAWPSRSSPSSIRPCPRRGVEADRREPGRS